MVQRNDGGAIQFDSYAGVADERRPVVARFGCLGGELGTETGYKRNSAALCLSMEPPGPDKGLMSRRLTDRA